LVLNTLDETITEVIDSDERECMKWADSDQNPFVRRARRFLCKVKAGSAETASYASYLAAAAKIASDYSEGRAECFQAYFICLNAREGTYRAFLIRPF